MQFLILAKFSPKVYGKNLLREVVMNMNMNKQNEDNSHKDKDTGSDTNPSPSPSPSPSSSLPELIKANTVSPLYRRSISPFRQHKNRYVPLLRLSGLWLESFGFGIGSKYEIYAMENQLILRTGSFGSSGSCELEEPMEVKEG